MRNFLLLVLVAALMFSCNVHRNEINYENIQILDFEALEPMLNSKSDTVYVVNFWATWCAPCVKEFPHFDEAAAIYSDKNVKFLMVSLDFPDQVEKSLLPFLKSRTKRLPVVLLDDPNQNEWINKVNPNWSGALPATLVYKGTQRVFFEGPMELEEITNAINNLLVKPLNS